ncbi:MAG TPA: hypothetical protein IAC62_10415 [Candidatus Pelethocola excrementipullorum]|nr:hypothetical protein [Candidatus Pelethocola excrementipullorum]
MYKQEELLPIIQRLMERYTSKESSSVSYETANMLAEAVVYCIDEWIDSWSGQLTDGKTNLTLFYKKGYEAVIGKVKKAGTLYNEMMERFVDYGCRNYKETIAHGMPAFFLRYDPEFNPQNHMLTLDYPTLRQNYDSCGIDLIYEYLKDINLEKGFLEQFPAESIRGLLRRFQGHFKIPYMENLCNLVMLQAIGCIIAERPVSQLELDEDGLEMIQYQFEGSKEVEMEAELRNYIRILTSRIEGEDAETYFAHQAREYTIRIRQGIEGNCLEEMFLI